MNILEEKKGLTFSVRIRIAFQRSDTDTLYHKLDPRPCPTARLRVELDPRPCPTARLRVELDPQPCPTARLRVAFFLII